ncbi:Hypp6430 [Branchiostoma lanceolatum]|uniref:Hypp6430 protein n=1 Tax=Branchiostoma lanceolatum TaxID=7740 RepID=A0A8J9YUB8_BRALA|nr:Hypp6430 [Branchiostoma lanceolatum]
MEGGDWLTAKGGVVSADDVQKEVAMAEQKFMIKNKGCGMVLDVTKGGEVVGSPVVLWDEHGADNQCWTYTHDQICTMLKPSGKDIALCIKDRVSGELTMSECITVTQNIVLVYRKEETPSDPADGRIKDQQWSVFGADGTIACKDDTDWVLDCGGQAKEEKITVKRRANPPTSSQQWEWKPC